MFVNTKSRSLASLFAAFFYFLSVTAIAVPKEGGRITYYSDASKTYVVGFTEVLCNGSQAGTGVETAYAEEHFEPCESLPPPPQVCFTVWAGTMGPQLICSRDYSSWSEFVDALINLLNK